MIDMKKQQVILIRHGKTKGNEEGRYLGKTDLPLSPLGRQEVENSEYPVAEIVFTSPRLRCIETAKIIYPESKPIVIDGLREMDFGDFEYKNYEELKDDPRYRAWIDNEDGTMQCPNGESREEFAKRCVAEFKLIMAEDYLQEAETVALVVHGGTIMSLMDKLTEHSGKYYDFMVQNGHGYICDFDGEKLQITAEI